MRKIHKHLCLLLSFILLIVSFSGCGKQESDKSDKKESEKQTIDVNSDSAEDNTNTDENNTKKQTLYILKAHSFKDGYALLELGNSSGDYVCHAVINTNEEVVSTFIAEDSYHCGSIDGKFYFVNIEGDSVLTCIDYTGKKVFEEEFITDNEISKYDNIELNDDGTICPIRKYGGLNESAMQYALMDSNGKYIKDWTYLYYNSNIIDFTNAKYCGEGILIVSAENGEIYMQNIYDGLSYKLDGLKASRGSGEMLVYMLDGYIAIGDCIISKNGTLINSDVNSSALTHAYRGNEDAVVYNHEEFSLYDVTMTNKIADVDFSDEIKSKPTKYGNFKNGYMPLTVTGSDGRMYTTLIDTKGQQAFEPIVSSETVMWNGENLVIRRYRGLTYALVLDIYDKNGTLTATIDLSEFSPKTSQVYYDDTLRVDSENFGNEGYWVIGGQYSATQQFDCYIKSDGTLLFPDGTIDVNLPQ